MFLLHCFDKRMKNSEYLSWRMAKCILIYSILVKEYSFIERISLLFDLNKFS